jgi:hypothetical protein
MTEYVRDESSEQPVETGRRPAIFLFQPHTFRRVTPARLAEWEQTMLTHFGLNADEMPFDERSVLRGGTWSDSGPSGQICADDSYNFADDLDLDAYPPDSDELPEQARPPAIFMFQPSSFSRVGPGRLAEWEQIMQTRVGLRAARFGEKAANSGTLSATLPNDCMDDSDYESE